MAINWHGPHLVVEESVSRYGAPTLTLADPDEPDAPIKMWVSFPTTADRDDAHAKCPWTVGELWPCPDCVERSKAEWQVAEQP